MATAEPSSFDSLLQRMFQRVGADTLPAHVARAHDIKVAKLSQLDVGVFRVDRADEGAPLVARMFSTARPHAAAQADLAVLRHLAEIGFPAERPFGDNALSEHEGQSVLVTEFIKEVPKAKRPPYPIVRLGATIGRLHRVDVPPGARRPAGALHHFAEGTMTDELRAVVGWLDSIESLVPSGDHDALDTIRCAVAAADGGDGLPEAFVHPDPVPKNVIYTAQGPVLVDWTSAGLGPRLASMTLILRSGWAAAPFWKGYARVASFTDEERERLAGLLFSRSLIAAAFRLCREPEKVRATAKRLRTLEGECHQKAEELLAL